MTETNKQALFPETQALLFAHLMLNRITTNYAQCDQTIRSMNQNAKWSMVLRGGHKLI